MKHPNQIHSVINPAIVWTRGLSDWESDRKLFGDAEARVLHLPCIRIVPRDLKGFSCGGLKTSAQTFVVFTSANAARFAMKIPAIVESMGLSSRIFTHGAVTAEILLAAGFKPQLVDAKGGKELGAFLAATLPENCDLLWPCGEAVAHDFSPDLRARHISVHRVVLYDTLLEVTDATGQPLIDDVRANLIQSLTGTICFASPSAARCFIEAFQPAKNRLSTSLTAIVIGPTTADEVQGHFQRVVLAHAATATALAADACRRRS